MRVQSGPASVSTKETAPSGLSDGL